MYRSAIFYHDQDQLDQSKAIIAALNESVYDGKIVTALEEFKKFWQAEDYHHNYFALNPQNSYCNRIVSKKYKKFLKNYEYITKVEGEEEAPKTEEAPAN